MRTFSFLILLTLLLLPAMGAHAEIPAECPQLKRDIESQIKKLNVCWEDVECTTVDFGCPFQKFECGKFYVSQDLLQEDTKIKPMIIHYRENCVAKDEAQAKQCTIFNQRILETQCPVEKLKCVNGRCLNRTQVLHQQQYF